MYPEHVLSGSNHDHGQNALDVGPYARTVHTVQAEVAQLAAQVLQSVVHFHNGQVELDSPLDDGLSTVFHLRTSDVVVLPWIERED
jgi:hypothetical protein